MTCKDCLVKNAAATFDVAALIQEQLALEPQLVSREVYQERCRSCEVCPHRLESTCGKCGCYYQFRANLPQKSCPVGAW